MQDHETIAVSRQADFGRRRHWTRVVCPLGPMMIGIARPVEYVNEQAPKMGQEGSLSPVVLHAF